MKSVSKKQKRRCFLKTSPFLFQTAVAKLFGTQSKAFECQDLQFRITAEDVAKAKEIIATVSAEKAANLPQQMIENIAKGRLGKFLKEVCLLNQEDIMDGKKTVKETMKEADPELQILAFKRFTLRSE